ncbi:MAG: hypothetical protein RMH77_00935 [Sulfolobales archaeon]|nr:hypothetical protein [Sulfolobales archaeon]MCX8186306.1 hypothetical protein [Sulfolobales archaeon]MDW7968958.1 hypothetical protein [Sulfolobales archaeon]
MRSLQLLELEGLILNGFVAHLEVVDCEPYRGSRLSKLVGKLRDGTDFSTGCYSQSRLRSIYLLYEHYRNKSLSVELSDEAVMSGITYDVE